MGLGAGRQRLGRKFVQITRLSICSGWIVKRPDAVLGRELAGHPVTWNSHQRAPPNCGAVLRTPRTRAPRAPRCAGGRVGCARGEFTHKITTLQYDTQSKAASSLAPACAGARGAGVGQATGTTYTAAHTGSSCGRKAARGPKKCGVMHRASRANVRGRCAARRARRVAAAQPPRVPSSLRRRSSPKHDTQWAHAQSPGRGGPGNRGGAGGRQTQAAARPEGGGAAAKGAPRRQPGMRPGGRPSWKKAGCRGRDQTAVGQLQQPSRVD